MPGLVSLTDAAVARIRSLTEGKAGAALRLSLKLSGCAGTSYAMEIVDAPSSEDELIEQDGVRLVIDWKAIMFLIGTEIDFQKTALASSFVFNNPNEVSACGCGESVALKACAQPA